MLFQTRSAAAILADPAADIAEILDRAEKPAGLQRLQQLLRRYRVAPPARPPQRFLGDQGAAELDGLFASWGQERA